MILNAKQIRFCEEYVKDFNASAAARRAGYSIKTAKEIGCENLTKPNIKAHIQKRLQELSLSAEETQKLLSDIARSSLNDYFTIRKVEHVPRIEVSLKQVIQQLLDDIAFEEEVMFASAYNEKEMEAYLLSQQMRKKELIRLQVELKHNPKATRIVNGPVQFVDVAELDMVKLVQDKERGRIKSITPNQFGTKVELYSAETALVNVGRIHGIFEKDNEQVKPENTQPLNDLQLDKLIAALKEQK